jgi:uncharacterized repeat protein (TIGR03803 family)
MKKPNFAKTVRMLFVICIAPAINLNAQTVTTLANFSGSSPSTALIQGVDGNFYSTASGDSIGGNGIIYKVTPSGTLTTVFTFCSNGCQNGANPFAPLILATNGDFYSTTNGGGAANEGTVFKMTPSGGESGIYSFCQTNCADGATPEAGLVQATNGALYGATSSTIFKITLGGVLTTLYTFCSQPNCADGQNPAASLIQASDGNFYGTTAGGGASGDGTLFKITPAGTLTTLHSFSGSDGANPFGSLVQGPHGSLYGVTTQGGITNNNCPEGSTCGTVFRITLDGTFTTLHRFKGSDGGNPDEGLVLATDGNFYGTTAWAGADNSGTIFQITPGGRLTTLYSFCSQTFCLDGVQPEGSLLQATNGTFYGTTVQGGTQTNGTVFSLSMGLGPFVQMIPTAAKVGAQVVILGYGLTGTTGVTFNGTTAAFTVVSDTEIKATVPTGASTGTVQVAGPGGTLNSNVAFRVTP